MSAFALFSLPETPFNKVMSIFQLAERYELSFSSPKAREIVKKWSEENEEEEQLLVYIEKRTFVVRTKKDETCYWKFADTRTLFEKEDVPTTYRTLSETTTVAVKKHETYFWDDYPTIHFCHYSDHREQTLEDVMEYLQRVLNAKIENFSLHILNVDFMETILNAKYLSKTSVLEVRNGILSAEEFILLLDNYRSIDIIVFDGIVMGNFEDGMIMKTYHLLLARPKWFSPCDLLRMDCEFITINSPNFISNEDFNKFILHWFNGNLNSLVHFSVTYQMESKEYQDAKSYEIDAMVAGIERPNRIGEDDVKIVRADGKEGHLRVKDNFWDLDVEFIVHRADE